MSIKLLCLSHSPLLEFCSPPEEEEKAARALLADFAKRVEAYKPDLIVSIGPDHFNGLFYDMMPTAVVGIRAEAAGDWNMGPGHISVPEDKALALTRHILSEDIGIAYSYRLQADHGVTQPLLYIAGGLTQYPVIPIVINSAAQPMTSMRYAYQLGRSIGRYLKQHHADERVLIIGSGGLSHDPPTPQMGFVDKEKEEFLICGRNPSTEARNKRQANVVAVGQALAQGTGPAISLNPEWDKSLLEMYKNADFDTLLAISNEEIAQKGGKGGQEIRCWTAAFGVLSEFGDYQADIHFYHPIDEWLAGFGAMSAQPVRS